jgi:hypothetical protein
MVEKGEKENMKKGDSILIINNNITYYNIIINL